MKLPKTLLLRMINSDINTTSCYDIDDIARRLEKNDCEFENNLIEFANRPNNIFLRNELRSDRRFEKY